MNKVNQVLLIEKFLLSNQETLIINQVNDDYGLFYLSVIKYYADKDGIKINIDDDNRTLGTVNDLFGQKEINLFNITSTKKLTSLISLHIKKIIFTDYKNYKKLSSKYNCINGYKYENDIVFFIQIVLKINNDELLLYCKNNPMFLFSEISKYLINKNGYSSDQAIVEEKNHILNIRKTIFEIKKNSLNIKNLYLNIKQEAKYKKLSFLIY